jgi:hypothetical protein
MNYIHPFDGSWDHRPYFEYLDGVRHLMGHDIYVFASDTKNHDLTSPNSLHDSWLSRCVIIDDLSRVERPGKRSARRSVVRIEMQ